MQQLTIKEAIKLAASFSSIKEAHMLLSHLLNKDRIYLLLEENAPLQNQKDFFIALDKLKQKIPIEYILQKVSFYSREFFIKEGALIPRPESELLVDELVKIAKNFDNPKIAEIGVGSGIISIIASLLLQKGSFIATDISKDAIEIAKINIIKFDIKNISLRHTTYLENIDDSFDIIVSNPPYIANDFKIDSKIHHEPKIALFGGEIGDEILKNIIDIAIEKKVKYLLCEMGYDQKEKIQNYMQNKNYKKLHFYKDLAGFDRGFVISIS